MRSPNLSRLALICLGLALAALAGACMIPWRAAAAQERADGQLWQVVSDPQVDGQHVRSLLATKSGKLWAASGERGLAVWDGQAWVAVGRRNGLPDEHVNALFEDRTGRVWVATNTGVGYLTREPYVFRKIGLAGLSALPVLAFAQDQDGSIWLGGANGLARWGDDGVLDNVGRFRGQVIAALFVAGDGELWVGASGGLWRRSGGDWRHVDELGTAGVQRVAGDSGGAVWAVTEDQGLWRGRDGVWEQVRPPVATRISAIWPAGETLWLGTPEGVMATSGERWVTDRVHASGGLPITALVTDAGHQLWAGTKGGLLVRQTDVSAPSISAITINGRSPRDGMIHLGTDRIGRLEISVQDDVTPGERLLVFAQLEGVDAEPRVLGSQDGTSYGQARLAAGPAALQVWVQDEGFNTSERTRVGIVVPQVVHLPMGLTVRRDIAEPFALGGLAVVGTLGTLTLFLLLIRGAKRAVEARAAARVREVVARGIDPFAAAGGPAGGPADVPEDVFEDRGVTRARMAKALRTGHVLLLGEQGMGKTTLLRDLQAALSDNRRGKLLTPPAYIDLAAAAPERWRHVLFGRVLAALEPLMTGEQPALLWREATEAAYGRTEFEADLTLVLKWLAPALEAREVHLVALLDGVRGGEAGNAAREQAASAFMQELIDAGFHLAVAAERAADRPDAPDSAFERILLAPLDHDRAHDLLRRRLSGLYDWDEAALARAVSSSGGRPGRLLACASDAVQRMLAAGRTRLLPIDFDGSCAPGEQVAAR